MVYGIAYMVTGGSTSCLLLLLVSCARFHVIEDPVPHHEEPGDDHVGEQLFRLQFYHNNRVFFALFIFF